MLGQIACATLAINPLNHDLYTVQQGRDMLFENWPQFYTQDQGANMPSEESYNQPLATFGAHWSPDGMVFYAGDQFPERYRGGAFIA